MIDKFCESFLLRIRQKRESYVHLLSIGSPKTMEEYKALCGKISGIDESEEIIKTLFNDLFGETKKINRDEIDD